MIMTDSDKKVFRSSDRFEIRNARVMWVGEPKEISDDKTLCSFKVVSQPGNEKDHDMWVTVTGANTLAERIFGLKVGDRINTAGKPTFRSYEDKEGKTVWVMEIKFPEYLDIVHRVDGVSTKPEAVEDKEESKEEEDENPVAKRKPGRPKKMPV